MENENIAAVYMDIKNSKTNWSIKTLEGRYDVTPGDWIITGIKGEVYPCKPDIFIMTYDEVGDMEEEYEDEKIKVKLSKEEITRLANGEILRGDMVSIGMEAKQ